MFASALTVLCSSIVGSSMWDCLPACSLGLSPGAGHCGSFMGLGPSLQHTPESLLWAGGSHSCFCLLINWGCWGESLDSVSIFFSCYLGFKFKCRKNTVCGSVFLCYSLILGFAKFAAFPNISKRKTSMMSPQKFCYSNCYCLGFSLLNASLTSSQLLCYLPLVSVFKASHCVLFASSPFLLFIFISSHAISWWWFLDSLLMAPFCLGWSHLITFFVMPPRTQLL